MPQTANPYSLLAELTYRCPLQCPYCSNPLKLHEYSKELDIATWKRVLAEAADLGVVQVHFSGGEPLLRRDLIDVVREARHVDLYTHLSTSGIPSDDVKWQQLRDAGLDALQISLQDSCPESSDWLAGVPSFEKKLRVLKTVKRLRFPVTLNVVLHRHNLENIGDLIELARQLDVEKLELAHVQYKGWAFRNRAVLLPSHAQIEQAAETVAQARERLGDRPEIVHVLPDYFQQFPKACLNGWGRVFLTVAPDGAVLPCQTAREIPGLNFPNVQTASLEEIWFHDSVFQRFRGTGWMPEPCRSCDRREIDYGGCRCQAFLLTGDLAATDPVCHLSPDHHLIDAAVSDATRESVSLQYRMFTT